MNEMDLRFNTWDGIENQQKIQVKLIYEATKLSTSKENSKLLSSSPKPKSNRSGNHVFLYYSVNKTRTIGLSF